MKSSFKQIPTNHFGIRGYIQGSVPGFTLRQKKLKKKFPGHAQFLRAEKTRARADPWAHNTFSYTKLNQKYISVVKNG